MSLKLSIIVPFYNVEKFIRQCLDSLLDQDISHNDYEIICVNDCSPDNSRSIVVEYQQKYSNIRLIDHTENKKSGAARNTGFDHAKGDYIWFVDSDDMISENCLKHVLCTCQNKSLDLLLINYSRCDENGFINLVDKVFTTTEASQGIRFVNTVFEDSFVYHFGYVIRMIFSAEYLRSINSKFPEGVFWEDTVYMPRTIILANRVASIADAYYIYRINTSSITQVTNREHRADLLFQFAFNTGSDLIAFSKEIEDLYPDMSKVILNRSKWYINSFGYRILRADSKQRRLFFELVAENREFIFSLRPYMTKFNRFLCENVDLGFILTRIISPLYKLKNKLKSK
jgi:glycosyltransferase involved in cell wall biosynthesis